MSGASADWPGYIALLAQAVAVGGMLSIWLFGREFSDHTAKDLLALPTSRTAIVAAKFALAGWALLLAAWMCLLGLLIGAVLGLPAWSVPIAVHGLTQIVITGLLAALLTTPLALAASIGRGHLPAVGAMFIIVFTAQVIAALGCGAYFRWSVPALYAGLAGPDRDQPGPLGFSLVLATAAADALATAAWRRRADHTH